MRGRKNHTVIFSKNFCTYYILFYLLFIQQYVVCVNVSIKSRKKEGKG